MTPQEGSKPGRTRREGNVIHIQTQFETRLRLMIIWEARQEARQAVIRKLKAEGRVRVSLLPRVEITRLAEAHLRAHAAELLAAAEASRVVQNLKVAHERRPVDRQEALLCSSPVRNEEPNRE
jgi:hypothetical protein